MRHTTRNRISALEQERITETLPAIEIELLCPGTLKHPEQYERVQDSIDTGESGCTVILYKFVKKATHVTDDLIETHNLRVLKKENTGKFEL